MRKYLLLLGPKCHFDFSIVPIYLDKESSLVKYIYMNNDPENNNLKGRGVIGHRRWRSGWTPGPTHKSPKTDLPFLSAPGLLSPRRYHCIILELRH